MTSAAGLLLWGLLLAAGLDSHCSVVLIPEHSPAQRLDLPCAEALVYRDAVPAGWIWNPLRPPVRFGAAAPLEWPPEAESVDSLRVVLAGGPPEGRGARLLAAPIQMWEEVPESLLPAWPLHAPGIAEIPAAPGRPLRLRLLDGDRGTWWIDLEAAAGTARLAAAPAQHLDFEILDPDGAPVELGGVQVLEPAAGLADSRVLAVYRADSGGRVAIDSLPADRPAAILVTGSGRVPRFLRGRLDGLPQRIPLQAGAELSARFLAGDGSPLEDVQAHVRSWLAGEAAMTYGLSAASDADGRWSLAGLPPGEAILLARKEGFGRLKRSIQVDGPAVDLGDLVLRPGTALEIRCVDDLGSPIPGAKLVTGTGLEAYGDARGVAVLDDLEPGRSLRLAASAPRHLGRETRVGVAAGAGPIDLVLPRAHTAAGRLIDDQGAPVAGGSVRTIVGTKSDHFAAGQAGRFEAGLEPRRPATLALSSASSLEIQVSVAAGEPGSVTELGDIVLPAGAIVTGRVLDDDTGLPVVGARIWAPRADARGPIVAWVRGDLLETRSDAAGVFGLRGVARQPTVLRVEAPGYARRHLPLSWLEEAGVETDLGEIYLSAGVSLVVRVEPPPATEASLRVDLRNEWLEPDMLSAPVVDGSATVDQVPPGPVTLTVVSGRDLLCVRELEVPDAGTLETECEGERYRVEGVVVRGGEPIGPGRLTWRPPAPEVAASIVRREQLGLRQTSVYGGGRPSLDVLVAPDGTFGTSRLAPGDWRVVWSSASQSPGAAVAIRLRDEPRQEVTIVVPGGVLRGRVTDAEGNGVASARVRLTPGGALAFSDGDGAFEIGGVAAGTAFLRARFDERSSDVVEVQLIEGVAPDPVLLVLGDSDETNARVRVLQSDSAPAAGALLFVEDDRGRWRVLTADQEGGAARPRQAPPASRDRVAVLHRGSWTLGDWVSTDEPLEIVLTDEAAAGLRIWTDRELDGYVRILAPGSWDLSWILTRAGLRPVLRPGRDLEVAGLPAGTYTISLGAAAATARLSAGELAEVRLD